MGFIGWIGTFEGEMGTGKSRNAESELVREFHILGAVPIGKVSHTWLRHLPNKQQLKEVRRNRPRSCRVFGYVRESSSNSSLADLQRRLKQTTTYSDMPSTPATKTSQQVAHREVWKKLLPLFYPHSVSHSLN